MKNWIKSHLHDIGTGVAIFAMAFGGAIIKGGSLTSNLIFAAAVAGLSAVAHYFLGKAS